MKEKQHISDVTQNEQLTKGGRTFRPVVDFEKGAKRSKCVARIIVEGKPKGTGFLVQSNWLLTNHHVIPSQAVAAASGTIAQFNYETGEDGLFLNQIQFRFDPEEGFATSDDENGNDWTIVKLKGNEVGNPNSLLGSIELSNGVFTRKDDVVHIIQHPDGQPKVFSSGKVHSVESERITYDTETLGGSSGAPVFNSYWQLVAVHHASIDSVDSSEPTRLVELNEGIGIHVLVRELAEYESIWPFEATKERPQVVDDLTVMDEDDYWYVEREADQRALRYFNRRATSVLLKGGVDVGKSSMSRRLEHAMSLEGWKVGNLSLRDDFSDEDKANGNTFLRQLSKKIVDTLEVSSELLSVFDLDKTPASFKRFLVALKGKLPDLRLLLTLDEVESLIGCVSCAHVLGALRLACTHQKKLGENAWLRLLVVYCVRPKEVGKYGSVFDVGRMVRISDFGNDELEALLSKYHLPKKLAPCLSEYFGGHPMLCRIALNSVVELGGDISSVYADTLADGGEFLQHLESTLSAFQKFDESGDLARRFAAIADGDNSLSQQQFECLTQLGVIRGESKESAELRCKLYRDWLLPRVNG